MPPKKGKAKAKASTRSTKSKATKEPVEEVEDVQEEGTSSEMIVVEAEAETSTKDVRAPQREDPRALIEKAQVSSKKKDVAPIVPAPSRQKALDEDVEMETATQQTQPVPQTAEPSSGPTMTKEQRLAKLEEIRLKMQTASQANRKDLVEEHQKQKTTARELARLEKQRKLAEILREKADAEDNGEDVERKKNWEWSIEENDEWEKRKARKERRSDFRFHDAEDAARRRYKKDLDLLKPDLALYNKQKEEALGLAPGTLSGQHTPKDGTDTQMVASSSGALVTTESLYRDANSLLYGDSKPSEDAIDRVVSKLNHDIDKRGKFSRKRLNEDEGDITYINERNRVFNKKIARYYDKYTAEIRASFERGTAL